MKGNKKLLESMFFLGLTILLLITSTLAWFTFNEFVDTNDIIVPVGSYQVDLEIKVQKNDEDLVLIKTVEEMQALLTNTVPNDTYRFQIKIKNQSDKAVKIIFKMEEVISSNCELDIRDVFYIVNGEVKVNENIHYLEPNSDEEKIIEGQKVNLYRFNNLLDSKNNLTIFRNQILELDETMEIEFQIKYDESTEHVGYHHGIFHIKGFFIYFNSL